MRFKHSLGLLRIVLCAALLSALAPAAAQAFATLRNQQVVELCTSFGFKKVVLPQPVEEGQDNASHHDGPFCGFCLGSHAPDVLTALRVSNTFPTPLAHVGSMVEAQHFISQFVWPAAQPRAPPLATA
ncbi:DUF2946 family protein [Uliginosibacterium gangwonense]|uniref:DUF2946 family protein n=1 Tax=Uliginosibacterium gangwonense TaxID=392736 RepID=UPI00035F3EE7|nr:DUF2946 family protein [Uliginosibacterium gangwonense]